MYCSYIKRWHDLSLDRRNTGQFLSMKNLSLVWKEFDRTFLSVFVIFIGFLFTLVFFSLWFSLRERNIKRERFSPFECGFDSFHYGRTPFSIRFFFFLVLFLVFDVELVLFFHFPTLYSSSLLFLISLFIVYMGFLMDEDFLIWEK